MKESNSDIVFHHSVLSHDATHNIANGWRVQYYINYMLTSNDKTFLM